MTSKRSVQLVLSCEHGGNKIPQEYQGLFANDLDLLDTHRGYDIGALDIAKALKDHLQCPLAYSDVSRLLIDTNRYLDGQNLFSEISQQLSESERQKVIEKYYKPHWEHITQLCRQRITNHSVVHIAVHSMTDNLAGQVRSMDLALLFDPKRNFETEFVNLWQSHLQERFPDFEIAQNEPYRGDDEGLTTYLRTQFPDAQYAGIELELNQGMLKKLNSKQREDLSSGLAESLQKTLCPENGPGV